jgi:diguanylate cyclase (GGDEF)-like protein
LANWIGGLAPEGEYRRVVRFGIGLVLVAALVTPVAGTAVGTSYALFAMLLAASIMGLSITALLLLVQAATMRLAPAAVLGAGFAYAAATLLPYALLYQGVFPGLARLVGATPTAYGYLWFLWQAGLLVAILAYQRLRLADPTSPRARLNSRALVRAMTLAYVVLTPLAIWLPGLPAPARLGHWTPVFAVVMAPLLALLAGVTLAGALRRRPRASVLDAWIAMVAFGIVVEVYLTVVGLGPFTVGWYASRAVVFFATTTLLAVLLAQACRLYADLVERAQVLESEAYTDIVTGLPNRRRFDEEFERAFGSAIRRSSPIAVAIVDIDHFKEYNDAFGHQAGDEALHLIAGAIAESVGRSGDFAARYGGEEFVVILEDTTLAGAIGVAERIRNTVLEAGIRAPRGGLLSVSAGVAARLPGSTGEELLHQADAALYAAKNGGRNRVAAWRSQETPPVGSAFDDAPI